MSRFLRTAVTLLFVSALAACGTFQLGRDFDVGVFAAQIKPGVTTEAQVHSWLGEPAGVGISVEPGGERMDQWNYYYAEGQMQDMSKTKMKILQIKFDKQGRVSTYNWSASK
jgi:outer membrane protein assembly factor BamE (lipoprotein component of BamABCDE complex)